MGLNYMVFMYFWPVFIITCGTQVLKQHFCPPIPKQHENQAKFDQVNKTIVKLSLVLMLFGLSSIVLGLGSPFGVQFAKI